MNIDERIVLLQNLGIFYHQSHQYVKNLLHSKNCLSVEHPILLFLISRSQPVLQKDLASMMHVKPATMSVHLKHLENLGMIQRVSGHKDKRESYVSLTDKGKQFLHEGYKLLLEVVHDMTDTLTNEEVEQLHALVSKMLTNLEKKGDRHQ